MRNHWKPWKPKPPLTKQRLCSVAICECIWTFSKSSEVRHDWGRKLCSCCLFSFLLHFLPSLLSFLSSILSSFVPSFLSFCLSFFVPSFFGLFRSVNRTLACRYAWGRRVNRVKWCSHVNHIASRLNILANVDLWKGIRYWQLTFGAGILRTDP